MLLPQSLNLFLYCILFSSKESTQFPIPQLPVTFLPVYMKLNHKSFYILYHRSNICHFFSYLATTFSARLSLFSSLRRFGVNDDGKEEQKQFTPPLLVFLFCAYTPIEMPSALAAWISSQSGETVFSFPATSDSGTGTTAWLRIAAIHPNCPFAIISAAAVPSRVVNILS